MLLAASAGIPFRLFTDDPHVVDEARAIGVGPCQMGLATFLADPGGDWIEQLLPPSTK
jgi:hypothetical protein